MTTVITQLEYIKMTMWTLQQKVFWARGLVETKSVKRVQRKFRRGFNFGRHDDVPYYVSIMKWDRQLRETGSLMSTCGKHSKRKVSAEIVERIHAAFVRSPTKSIKHASVHS